MKTPKTLAALSLCLALASAASAGAGKYVGEWLNTDSKTRGITAVTLREAGGKLTLQAWGQCHPKDCDWGAVPATAFPPERGKDPSVVTAEFDQGFAKRWLIVRLRGEQLHVETFVKYKEGDRRAPQRSQTSFKRKLKLVRPIKPMMPIRPVKPVEPVKPIEPLKPVTAVKPIKPLKPVTAVAARIPPVRIATPVVKEDCIPFQTNQLEMKQINGRWKIVAGSMWLLDFESNRSEAIRALRVLRHYRLSKQCFVGRPDPGMSYWLNGGAAPDGPLPGEDCVSMDPAKVVAEQAGGRWKVAEGSHWIFDFDTNATEARDAAAIIKKYGFTKSCFVGRPDPSFSYLRR